MIGPDDEINATTPTPPQQHQRLRRLRPAAIGIGLIIVVGLVIGAASALGFATGWSKAAGGEVIVVRNGGFLDDNSFRQVIQPNSELTYTGLWSIDHPYPASQRYFKVSAAQNADSNEVINVPTKDGVLVGVEGTFYFQLSTEPAILEDFDNKFGTRTFPGGDKSLHAWDGDEGWNAFLAATLGNLVQNVLRQEIGNVTCADLVASCTLAQNSTDVVVPTDGKGNQTIAQVQQAVNSGFAADVQNILGVPVLTNIQFALSKISLPDNVQQAINDAQGAFAGVTKAQAGLQQAAIDPQTNAKKQEGYNARRRTPRSRRATTPARSAARWTSWTTCRPASPPTRRAVRSPSAPRSPRRRRRGERCAPSTRSWSSWFSRSPGTWSISWCAGICGVSRAPAHPVRERHPGTPTTTSRPIKRSGRSVAR